MSVCSEAKKSINFHYSTKARNYPYGFIILDPEGKHVGIWYFIWDWTTVIMEEGNQIEVYSPIRPDPLNELGDEFEGEQKF